MNSFWANDMATIVAESDLKELVSDAVRKTVNKFRKYPYIFFTETDIHAYFYHCLYSRRLDIRTADGILTNCLHKEYPTNFRYRKKDMKDYGLKKKGRRGRYDVAVLNPQFILESKIKNVENKNVRYVEERSKNEEKFRRELIAVIEFKHIVNNQKSFIGEFEKDATKLSHGRKYQDFEAYNLVFCNRKYHYFEDLREGIKTFETENPVKNLLGISYYENSRKETPKPITNGWSI